MVNSEPGKSYRTDRMHSALTSHLIITTGYDIMAPIMMPLLQSLFGPKKGTPESAPVAGQLDFADRLAHSASSVLPMMELSPGIATRMVEPSVPAKEVYATANIYGASRNDPTFIRATKLENPKLRQESMSEAEEVATKLYAPEIDELSKRILAHFQSDAPYNRRDVTPVIFSVHTSDLLIGQAVIKNAVSAAVHTIIESAKTPLTNGHDLNGGNALIVQIDNRWGVAENSSTAIHIARGQDEKEAIHGTQTATGLLIIADPNGERSAAHSAVKNIEFFRSETIKSETPMGSPPLILVATDAPFETKEGQVLLPTITEEQWEKLYIPIWAKNLGITKALREIAGPTLSRVDTMLAIATLQRAKDSWDSTKEPFEKQFKNKVIPPAILRDIAVNMIRFGTNFKYKHLGDPSNMARSLQLMLGITGFMDETGTIPSEKRDACLSILKAKKSDAEDIMQDIAEELSPMAYMRGVPSSLQFKSFGLFAVLRQLNQQEVMLNIKSLVFKFPPETRVCCGHCLRGVKIDDAACDGCGAPGGSFVFQIIPVKK